MRLTTLSIVYLCLGILTLMFVPLCIDLENIESTITKIIILVGMATLMILMGFIYAKGERK